MAERPRHHVEQVGEENLLGIDRDRAGFDLRQIENVADQIEQVGAGAVDGAGELDLFAGQVAFRVVGELLAEDQDRIERRAQLVRHVGEEFGFVLRRQRELGGLFFQRAAGLLDFLILALDFDVALGELLGLLLELLVGLLQLSLLRLQFAGELLRLLEQALGLHRRLDRVEHDADRGGELLEEHGLQRGEFVDRSELDHRLDLVLEQHRQHDGVARRQPEQSRRDRRWRSSGISVISMRRLSTAHWPIRPSPSRSADAMAVGAIIGIGRQQSAAPASPRFPSDR